MLNSAETRRLMTGGIGVGGRKLVHNYGIFFFFFLGGGGGVWGECKLYKLYWEASPTLANYYFLIHLVGWDEGMGSSCLPLPNICYFDLNIGFRLLHNRNFHLITVWSRK